MMVPAAVAETISLAPVIRQEPSISGHAAALLEPVLSASTGKMGTLEVLRLTGLPSDASLREVCISDVVNVHRSIELILMWVDLRCIIL